MRPEQLKPVPRGSIRIIHRRVDKLLPHGTVRYQWRTVWVRKLVSGKVDIQLGPGNHFYDVEANQ